LIVILGARMTEGFGGGEKNKRRADQAGSVSSAWVWSQYNGEFPQTASEREWACQTAAVRVTRPGGIIMALSNRTKLGITVAVAVLVGLTSVSLAVLLLVLAVFLIAWGQDPKRTEAFVGSLPYGSYLLKGLAQSDLILTSWGLKQ